MVEMPEGAVVSRTLVIPSTPPSKNVYDAWDPRWKSSYVKKKKAMLVAQINEQNWPLARRVVVHARLIFGSRRRHDWQNYTHPLWHYVADALVDAGIIIDDTPEYFSVGPDGGIEFDCDLRPFVPVKKRNRTVIGCAIELR